jgi:hypothetical protein
MYAAWPEQHAAPFKFCSSIYRCGTETICGRSCNMIFAGDEYAPSGLFIQQKTLNERMIEPSCQCSSLSKQEFGWMVLFPFILKWSLVGEKHRHGNYVSCETFPINT